MNCMKCGIELKTPASFCPDCLAEMEKYPVKPNVTIKLPLRPIVPASRKRVRRHPYVKPEDQIRHLKKVRGWLTGLLVLAILLLGLCSAVIVHLIQNQGEFDLRGIVGLTQQEENR